METESILRTDGHRCLADWHRSDRGIASSFFHGDAKLPDPGIHLSSGSPRRGSRLHVLGLVQFAAATATRCSVAFRNEKPPRRAKSRLVPVPETRFVPAGSWLEQFKGAREQGTALARLCLEIYFQTVRVTRHRLHRAPSFVFRASILLSAQSLLKTSLLFTIRRGRKERNEAPLDFDLQQAA